jgi:hypothetical protein
MMSSWESRLARVAMLESPQDMDELFVSGGDWIMMVILKNALVLESRLELVAM